MIATTKCGWHTWPATIAMLALSSVQAVHADERAVTPNSSAAAVASSTGRVEAGPAAARPVERQREGTKLVEEVGTFEFLGDRAAFLPSGNKESYRVLENLALERVSRQTGDPRGPQQWMISGILTEFKGANYLLITKAVARGK